MKSILLIGLSRFGQYLARDLNAVGNEILAVDINEARVQEVLPYATQAQIGDATNEDFLRRLGVSSFDLCIVAIAKNFESSLEVTSLLRDFGAKKIVAQAGTEFHKKFLLRNGADHVVFPEEQLAEWTAVCFSSESVFDYFDLAGDDNAIMEIAVPEEWNGKTIAALGIRNKFNINIIALKDDNGVLNTAFAAQTVLEKGQRMLVLGQKGELVKCFKKLLD